MAPNDPSSAIGEPFAAAHGWTLRSFGILLAENVFEVFVYLALFGLPCLVVSVDDLLGDTIIGGVTASDMSNNHD
jgi:hypothetical protein